MEAEEEQIVAWQYSAVDLFQSAFVLPVVAVLRLVVDLAEYNRQLGCCSHPPPANWFQCLHCFLAGPDL